MTSGRYGLVLREVGRLLGGGTVASLAAGPLLERFAADRDKAAFEALVSRHGPMVLGTCRRMLSDPLDVEDAFQATFLVLARKAGSIQDADRLGPWLHGVARRVAARSRALSGRRKSVERPGGDEPSAESPDLLEASEIREVLDEELARLPEKYQAPLVLCYLEGLTHDEAAEALRWPVGTVRSRLAGGRDRLRTRLARRGLAPSAAVPVILARASIPQTLLSTTVRVATTAGSPSAHVLILAKGVLIAMTWNKLKIVATLALTAGLTAGGVGVAAQRGEAGKEKKETRVEEFPAGREPILKEIARIRSEERLIEKRLKELNSEHQKAIAPLLKAFDDLNSRDSELSRRLSRMEKDEASTTLDDRFKQLEKQLADQAAVIQALQDKPKVPPTQPGPWPAPTTGHEGINPPMEPVPGGSRDEIKAEVASGGMGTGTGPRASTVRNLWGDPPLFASVAGGGSRVTMIDPASKAKATYQLPGGLITTVTPSNVGNDLFPLAMTAHKVTQLAVFDRRAWRWVTLDLDGSIRMAQANEGSGITLRSGGLIGFTLNGSKITKLVAFSPWTRDWVTQDLKEPVLNGQITPTIFPDALAYPRGRHFYAYSIPAKKWANLELKQPINWGPDGLSYAPVNGKIIIPEEDAIHTLDVKTGEWTHIDTKDEGAK